MDLKENQAALILEASADGEITMDVQSPDSHSFASALCHALAMKLMGLESCMGLPFIGSVEQWMQGPPQEARDAMSAVGVTLPWGTDYCVNGRASLCSGAWRKVFA